MREMHEIESQRAALPPIPASTVKDHLNDNAWALQYIEDSRQFNVFIYTLIFLYSVHNFYYTGTS